MQVNNIAPAPARPTAEDLAVVDMRDEADRSPADRAVYTVKETAGLLSLSLGSTYALIRGGGIPAVKLGGRWVVPKARFHAWLNSTNTGTLDELAATAGGGAR